MKNEEDDRFGSFFKRVETERAALKVVNQAFSSCRLHGLTETAIKSWGEKIGVVNDRRRKQVEKILLALSARIDALADQSRVVFSGESFNLLASHQLLVELEHACSNTRGPDV